MMHRRLSLLSFSCRTFIQSANQIRSLHFSTSVSSPPHFLPSYLQTKYSFSPDRAAKVSKLLGRVKSPSQPDSVINFFKSHGFEDSHLKKLVYLLPRCLALNVEKTLAPKFDAFRELGFKGDDLITLVCSNPNVLVSSMEKQVVPMINLLRRLLGSHNLLMKCLTNGRWQIIGSKLDVTLSNISFLRDLGTSDHQISLIASKQPYMITQKPESLKELVSRVERLGLPRGSFKFHWALYALAMVSEDKLQPKVELFEGFKWSEDDFSKAFHKAPNFIMQSLKNLKEKMEFFVNEAGCTASSIALNPTLLTYSLEKRLIPRLKILKALKEKGLCGVNYTCSSIMSYTEKVFFERFVAPYKEEIPHLSHLFSASS